MNTQIIFSNKLISPRLCIILTFLLTLASCQKQKVEPVADENLSAFRFDNNGIGNGTISAAMVLQWNQAAIDVVTQTQQVIAHPPIPPFIESRYYAMVNIAMHDALNNIVPKYKTYALNNAVDINSLRAMLLADINKTFDTHSHALGIGNVKYFLIKGEGEITCINENDVTILVKADSAQHAYTIATEFVYGNALRDASGLISLNEFNSTMDINNVSEETNKIVRNEVLPPFKKTIKKGDVVQFFGAIELNKEHLDVENIEIIPISLKITNQK